MNWTLVFNRLFEIINTQGDTYYSGPRFLEAIREVARDLPSYQRYIDQRREENRSTSRREYYYDLLMDLSEPERVQAVNSILNVVESIDPERSAAIRLLLVTHRQIQGPQAAIPGRLWNSDRLVEYLEGMDISISEGNFEYALTLAYTCLEGFYKSFIIEKIPSQIALNELTPMAVQIRGFIKGQLDANGIVYPDQVLTLISTVTNAICNARNNFSDSHSANRAERWLAVYVRDNVNSVIKLLLNFI